MIVSDHEFPDPKTLGQNPAYEHLGGQPGQRMSERQKGDVVEPALRQDLLLFGRSGEQSRSGIAADDRERMTIERHDNGSGIELLRIAVGLTDDLLVAEVNAVEETDRQAGLAARDCKFRGLAIYSHLAFTGASRDALRLRSWSTGSETG